MQNFIFNFFKIKKFSGTYLLKSNFSKQLLPCGNRWNGEQQATRGGVAHSSGRTVATPLLWKTQYNH